MLRRNGAVIKSVETGREFVVGKICERGRFEPEVKERGSYGW